MPQLCLHFIYMIVYTWPRINITCECWEVPVSKVYFQSYSNSGLALCVMEMDWTGSFLKLPCLSLDSPLRSPDKKQEHPKTRPHLRAPDPMVSQMFPSIADRRAMMEAKKGTHAQHSQMPCSARPANDPPQTHRGLTVKCLSSFRGKITTSDWRTQERTNSEQSFKMLSGDSRSQVIGKVIDTCYFSSAKMDTHREGGREGVFFHLALSNNWTTIHYSSFGSFILHCQTKGL